MSWSSSFLSGGDPRTPAEITEAIRLAAWKELRLAREAMACEHLGAEVAVVHVRGARGYMRRYVQRRLAWSGRPDADTLPPGYYRSR